MTIVDADNNGKPEPGFPVVITSYEIVLADIKFMQKVKWNYIIVDEGHRLKNWNCKLLRELRTLPSANKLILSGRSQAPSRQLRSCLLIEVDCNWIDNIVPGESKQTYCECRHAFAE